MPRPRTPCSCTHPPVLADARARTLAPVSHPPVLADARAPHSLHLLRRLPCSQMLSPRTPCTCSLPPVLADARAPHSLHCFAASRARRSETPSLHCCTLCSQIPFPGHSLQWYPRLALPCGHNGPRGPLAFPERDRLPRFASIAACLARSAVIRRTERGSDERSVFSEAFGTTNRRGRGPGRRQFSRYPPRCTDVRSLPSSSSRRTPVLARAAAPRALRLLLCRARCSGASPAAVRTRR